MAGAKSACRLMILAEARPSAAAIAQLTAALDAADVACVVLVPAGERPDPAELKSLVELVQAKGAAALLYGDARMARTVKADGVHLPWSRDAESDVRSAREIMGGRQIVGADAGQSRHDAMTLGEIGADYVAFGLPSDPQGQGEARELRIELMTWWAEIFEIPCVALGVESPDEAAALASVGADFVAVRLMAGESAADSRDRVGAVAAAITAQVAARGAEIA